MVVVSELHCDLARGFFRWISAHVLLTICFNPLGDFKLVTAALSAIVIILFNIDRFCQEVNGRLILTLFFLIGPEILDVALFDTFLKTVYPSLMIVLDIGENIKLLLLLGYGFPRLVLELIEHVLVVIFTLFLIVRELHLHASSVVCILLYPLVRLIFDLFHEFNNSVFGDIDHALITRFVDRPIRALQIVRLRVAIEHLIDFVQVSLLVVLLLGFALLNQAV